MKTVRLVCAALLLATTIPVLADTAAPPPPRRPMQRGGLFPMKEGEAIYQGVCQGCHMPDAKGAIGAGAYPALAKNANLEIAGYPIGVIVKGQKAMPPFADSFNDEQIANVVNYVRSHFGNKYRDKVKPEDVKIMR
jgi:mono/diheme cytochrome c family protein